VAQSPDPAKAIHPGRYTGSMFAVVLVTAPDTDVAARLGRTLVEERLAACVNVLGGLRSIYRWQGKVCDDAEALMIIKTTRDQFEALQARVTELHPYEVAEVILLPIEAGAPDYLGWLAQQVSPEAD
jgi:periplasmic divalent cation tolerance protein